MKTSEKKLAGLRRHHADRHTRTRSQLMEALDRMESGLTLVVGPRFPWTKATLATEAHVNINTVVKKLSTGEWAFPEVIKRFDSMKRRHRTASAAATDQEQMIGRLRSEVRKLSEEKRLLAQEVGRLGGELLKDRARAVEFEQQNASLREENRRLTEGNGQESKRGKRRVR
jgi:hypothetical protein